MTTFKQITALVAWLGAALFRLHAVEFYVSPTGHDANPGTAAQPFQTLERGRDAVRALKAAGGLPVGGVNVVLLGGQYRLTGTFVLTLQDSGQPGRTVRYRAATGSTPHLTSATPITGWQPYTHGGPALQPAARGHVWVAAVPAGWRFHFLYLDGQPQPVASLCKTDDWHQWPKPEAVGATGPGGQPLTLADGLLAGVPTNGDLEINLMPVEYWNTLSVVRDIDAIANTCRRHSKSPTTFRTNYFGYTPGEFGNFNLLNALKFLTQPGEWCVDSAAGRVYFWPPGDSLAGKQIWAPSLYRLIHCQGANDGSARVHDLEICGLTMSCTDRMPEDQWPDEWVKRQAELPDAMLFMEGVADCAVVGNTFRHSGSYCVALQNHAERVGVVGNEMAYPGCGGVLLQGFGPGLTDVNHGHVIRRNYMHHTGNGGYLHSAAVTLYQSGGNNIALNWIDSVPYVGIQIAGAGSGEFGPGMIQGGWDAYGVSEAMYKVRWDELPAGTNSTFTRAGFKPYLHSRSNRISNNILTAYLGRMSDGGGLYSWACGLGNLWDNNLLRRDVSNPGQQWCLALYMDDYVDGATLSNNVCWHVGPNTTINKGENVWVGNVVSATRPATYDTRLQEIASLARCEGGWLNHPTNATLPPLLTGIVGDGAGGVQLNGIGTAGEAYLLLVTTNLLPALWRPVATNDADVRGVLQFSDLPAVDEPQRFYRLRGR